MITVEVYFSANSSIKLSSELNLEVRCTRKFLSQVELCRYPVGLLWAELGAEGPPRKPRTRRPIRERYNFSVVLSCVVTPLTLGKGASLFPHESYFTYKSTLSGAYAEI